MANERARKLRSNLTDAERKLWRQLRALRSRGFHFRRQAPIDRYIVDFVCFSTRLIIEVDGGQHNFPEHERRDRVRDRYLQEQGFSIQRYWNNDVLRNSTGVMEHVMMLLAERTPTPNPSPQGGGEPAGVRGDWQ